MKRCPPRLSPEQYEAVASDCLSPSEPSPRAVGILRAAEGARRGGCFECGHELAAPFCPACNPAPVDQAELARLKDEVEGLTADTAYHRGAKEWTRLNYPKWFERLEAARTAGPDFVEVMGT